MILTFHICFAETKEALEKLIKGDHLPLKRPRYTTIPSSSDKSKVRKSTKGEISQFKVTIPSNYFSFFISRNAPYQKEDQQKLSRRLLVRISWERSKLIWETILRTVKISNNVYRYAHYFCPQGLCILISLFTPLI